jgi:hypothetical protein
VDLHAQPRPPDLAGDHTVEKWWQVGSTAEETADPALTPSLIHPIWRTELLTPPSLPVLQGPEIAFRPVHQKSSANFGKSLAIFTKTSMQHSHEGSIRYEMKVFLCL